MARISLENGEMLAFVGGNNAAQDCYLGIDWGSLA